MSAHDLVPQLAAQLDGLVPAEAGRPDWRDVVRRVEPRSVRSPKVRVIAAVAVLAIVLAAVATATYLVLHRTTGSGPTPGSLTLVEGGYNIANPARIVEVLPGGGRRVVWHCPGNRFCGNLEGVDWSLDGRHVAFTLGALNFRGPYLGLHILDVRGSSDIHLLGPASAASSCTSPGAVAWSPNGHLLAYGCTLRSGRAGIVVVGVDGRGARLLPTHGLPASFPTWSPDGTRLAFSTVADANVDFSTVTVAEARLGLRSGPIYTVRLDGSGLLRIASHGRWPDWSPSGKTIAITTAVGIEFVTPSGVDVTPSRLRHFGGIRTGTTSSWSPDGRTLAIGTDNGVYLVDASGGHLRRVAPPTGSYAGIRPAWYPGPHRSIACGGC